MSDRTPESSSGASVNSTSGASQKYTRVTVHQTADGTISVGLRTPRRDGESRHPDDPTAELKDLDLNVLPRVPYDPDYC